MTKTDAKIDSLFEPVTFDKIQLTNRIVMPSMGVHRAQDGIPSSRVAEYYRQRAEAV